MLLWELRDNSVTKASHKHGNLSLILRATEKAKQLRRETRSLDLDGQPSYLHVCVCGLVPVNYYISKKMVDGWLLENNTPGWPVVSALICTQTCTFHPTPNSDFSRVYFVPCKLIQSKDVSYMNLYVCDCVCLHMCAYVCDFSCFKDMTLKQCSTGSQHWW